MKQLTQEVALRRLRRYAKRWGGDILEVTEEEFDALSEQYGRTIDLSELNHPSDLARLGRENLGTAPKNPTITDEAPSTGWQIGIGWGTTQAVYFSAHAKPDVNEFVATICHELGHLFATKESPESCEEFDFLGWELILAMKIGITQQEWCVANKDYTVLQTGAYDIGDLLKTPRRLQSLLRRRVARAKQLGLIKRERPVAIRHP